MVAILGENHWVSIPAKPSEEKTILALQKKSYPLSSCFP